MIIIRVWEGSRNKKEKTKYKQTFNLVPLVKQEKLRWRHFVKSSLQTTNHLAISIYDIIIRKGYLGFVEILFDTHGKVMKTNGQRNTEWGIKIK